MHEIELQVRDHTDQDAGLGQGAVVHAAPQHAPPSPHLTWRSRAFLASVATIGVGAGAFVYCRAPPPTVTSTAPPPTPRSWLRSSCDGPDADADELAPAFHDHSDHFHDHAGPVVVGPTISGRPVVYGWSLRDGDDGTNDMVSSGDGDDDPVVDVPHLLWRKQPAPSPPTWSNSDGFGTMPQDSYDDGGTFFPEPARVDDDEPLLSWTQAPAAERAQVGGAASGADDLAESDSDDLDGPDSEGPGGEVVVADGEALADDALTAAQAFDASDQELAEVRRVLGVEPIRLHKELLWTEVAKEQRANGEPAPPFVWRPLPADVEELFRMPSFAQRSFAVSCYFAIASLGVSGKRIFYEGGAQSYKIQGTTYQRLLSPTAAAAAATGDHSPILWQLHAGKYANKELAPDELQSLKIDWLRRRLEEENAAFRSFRKIRDDSRHQVLPGLQAGEETVRIKFVGENDEVAAAIGDGNAARVLVAVDNAGEDVFIDATSAAYEALAHPLINFFGEQTGPEVRRDKRLPKAMAPPSKRDDIVSDPASKTLFDLIHRAVLVEERLRFLSALGQVRVRGGPLVTKYLHTERLHQVTLTVLSRSSLTSHHNAPLRYG